MKALVLATALMLLALAAHAQTAAAAYGQAKAALKLHQPDYTFLDSSTEGPSLLAAKYLSFETWVADWLNSHPTAPLADLTTAAANLDDIGLTVARLDAHALLISASWGEEGTVFILSGRPGHYAMAWDISKHGPDPSVNEGANLAAWQPERIKDNCREITTDDAGAICGPLYASVGVLSPMRDGLRRFYVHAGYGTLAGATIGQQFSIWTWNGHTARPVLVHVYSVMVEQAGFHAGKHLIRIPAKGWFKQMFACGSCVGQEMEIDVHLADSGRPRLTSRSLTPELDLIDELYDRARKGKPAQSLATPNVIRQIQAEVKDVPDNLTLGMIMNWRPTTTKGQRTICLNTDNDAGPHLFTLAGSGKRFKVVGVQLTKSQCDGPDARN